MRPVRSATLAPPSSVRLEARIPADVKDLYARAAAARGQTLTDFVVSAATDAALRVIREQDILELSKRDQQAFAAALTRPPAPSSKLQAAVTWAREQAATDG